MDSTEIQKAFTGFYDSAMNRIHLMDNVRDIRYPELDIYNFFILMHNEKIAICYEDEKGDLRVRDYVGNLTLKNYLKINQ